MKKKMRVPVYPRRVFRTILMLAMLVFVMLNMHILMNFHPDSVDEDYRQALVLQGQHGQLGEMHVQFHQDGVEQNLGLTVSKPNLVIPPAVAVLNATTQNNPADTTNIKEIQAEISRVNTEQHIHNLGQFGLKLGSESIVIVVQVHDRAEYLKLLIESLRKVRNIHHVFLIFSHDVYAKNLNDLVTSINFCPVMQIFFPYSQQVFHSEFPGEHPNDCPRNIKKDEAMKKKCNNAEHPDKYGHYREAKYCQAKHHWIWKLHHVFERTKVLKDYEGMVLLLEDDYYVTEDVLTVLQMMQNLQHRDCKDCKMLAVGNYDKTQNYQVNAGKVEKAYWISSRHNMGMVFTRQFWNEVKKCHKEFCNHDDYNWDWTLQHLSMKCIPNKVRLLVIKATRIFHIGECGIHHKGKSCNPQDKIKKVEDMLNANKKYLFPNVITVAGESRFKLREPKANGGWGDLRDRELCLSYFKNTTVR